MNKYEMMMYNPKIQDLDLEEYNLVKELVDKQVPKKITWTKGNSVYEYWICPHCKDERDPYDEPRDKYCSNCGGALIEED